MLSIYDLFDLSAVFKNIRMEPLLKENAEIVRKVHTAIVDNLEQYRVNRIRIALRDIKELNSLYDFAYVNNVYTHYPTFLKDKNAITILLILIEHLESVLVENIEKKIISFADCIHNLPIYLVDNNCVPTKFLKKELRSYSNKWDAQLYKKIVDLLKD